MKKRELFKKGISLLLSATMVFASATVSGIVTAEEADAASYQLVWSDEFNGNSLDTSKWNYEIGTGSNGWGNAELQYYTNRPENTSVYDGVLHINARREDYNGSQYTSARIQTHGKFDFTYGRVEARLRIPKGNAFWPAFWLLGSNYTTSAWPSCGEIDVMEHVNYDDTTNGHLHWGADANVGNSGYHADYGNASYVNNITDWHVYSIEWTSQYIKWFVDGAEYQTVDTTGWDMEEFHHDYFIILNFAVGGYWPQWNVNEAELPASFDVDYVRVYQLGEDSGDSGNSGSSSSESYPAASVANGEYYLKGVNTGKIVCADNYGNNTLIANKDAYGGDWEKITLVNNSDGTVSLLSGANNKYVCMVNDDQQQLLARSSAIDAWEKFWLVQVSEDQYALKSAVNNKYVTVNQNDSNNLYAAADSVQAWELFNIYTTSGNQVSSSGSSASSLANGDYYLKGMNTGKVICADNYGNDTLIGNRDAYGGDWEKITLINNSDGTVSLLSGANGKYVCMVYDDQCQLIARSSAIDAWEKFYLEKVGDNQWALKSAVNNMYVTVNENDSNNLYATAGSVQAWEIFNIYTTSGAIQ